LSFSETVVLGALAGFTIYLGLPFGRLRLLSPRTKVGLSMFAVGVLAFLFVDVFEHAFGIVEGAVERYKDGEQGVGEAVGLAAMLGAGFAAGSAGFAMLERWMRAGKPASPTIAGGAVDALTVEETDGLALATADARTQALRVGMTIAAAIGLHNFAEGLAIGVSASTGEISLATVLIIGFALHNATEGFGIIGPLGNVRPSWTWLAVAGLVGGGPTFLGSIVGYNVTAEPLELAFYAVAGGAILYVIGEVWNGMRRFGHREVGLWMVSVGFVLGIVTDLVVVYGGA
jgi:zinc transporter, ZIP family